MIPSIKLTSSPKPDPTPIKFPERPLLSLGYHHLLMKARSRMTELSSFPDIEDIQDLLHPYSLPRKNVKDAEMKEIKASADPLPAKTKKTKKAVGGVDKPSTFTALLAALQTRPSNQVVIKCYDYVITQSTLRLLYLLAASYKKVEMIKPKVVPDFTPIFYIVATEALPDKSWGEKQIVEKNGYLRNVYPDLHVPEDFHEAVSEINRGWIAREVRAVTRLYDFVKAKDFFGATREHYIEQQKEKEKEWMATYATAS